LTPYGNRATLLTRMKIPIFFAAILTGLYGSACTAEPTSAVVIVPVADVWSRPMVSGETPKDELRETQVLFGERVIVHESSGAWVRIEAVEQPTFRQHNRWEGYPGWILKSNFGSTPTGWEANTIVITKWLPIYEGGKVIEVLPLGSYLRTVGKGGQDVTAVVLPDGHKGVANFEGTLSDAHHARAELIPGTFRQTFIHPSKLLMGDSYLWGGLTPEMDPVLHTPWRTPAEASVAGGLQPAGMTSLGIDCSGLIHLIYRVNGMTIPRDAHEQWMKATPIKRADLKPADLIFSAKADNPKTITHAALYTGEGQIIEAPQTGTVVRKISFKEKYGRDLSQVESGQTVGDRVIYFGSFLHD